jgi:hypothetical protein
MKPQTAAQSTGDAMPEYVLLNYQPVEHPRSREEMATEYQLWQSWVQELKDAGLLRDNRGLRGVDAATTVRVRDGQRQITDGPFAETKEYLGGYFLIEADDLDTALAYAATMPVAAYGSVEVRPVWG